MILQYSRGASLCTVENSFSDSDNTKFSYNAAREEGEYDYPIDELTCNDSPIEMNRYGRGASPSTVGNPFWDSDSIEFSDLSQTAN